MAPWEIKNKIAEIRSYIASQYFDPSQAKILYKEIDNLERLLKNIEDNLKD